MRDVSKAQQHNTAIVQNIHLNIQQAIDYEAESNRALKWLHWYW